jgi:hypothetical protein
MECLNFEDIISLYNEQPSVNQLEEIKNHIQKCKSCELKIKQFGNLGEFITTYPFPTESTKPEICYTDLEILSYLESASNKKLRENFFIHINKCETCLEKIISLEQFLFDEKTEQISSSGTNFFDSVLESLSSRGKALAEQFAKIWSSLQKPKLAFGSIVLVLIMLSFGFIYFQTNKLGNIPIITREIKVEENAARFELIHPENGSVLTNSGIEFTWLNFEKNVRYKFILLDEYGDIIWEENTRESFLILPNEIKLESQNSYFWKVDATFNNGNVLSSKLYRFNYNYN